MAKLYFKYGVMNCGKSTKLLQDANNYYEKNMNAILLKPSADTRDGKDECIITSRLGITGKGFWIFSDTDIYKKIEYMLQSIEISAIFIDEAQFLVPEQVDQLLHITISLKIPVLCYGLKNDFQTHLFPGSKRLLEVADEIEELNKTICWCGHAAKQNARVINNKIVTKGDQIQIGGNESYTTLCNKHYLEKKLKK